MPGAPGVNNSYRFFLSPQTTDDEVRPVNTATPSKVTFKVGRDIQWQIKQELKKLQFYRDLLSKLRARNVGQNLDKSGPFSLAPEFLHFRM